MIEDGLKNKIVNILKSIKIQWNDSEIELLEDLGFVRFDGNNPLYVYRTKMDNLIIVEKLDYVEAYRINVSKGSKILEADYFQGERNLFLALIKYKNEY